MSTPEVSTGATAIVVAGDEETRVLLRGLLRLHHFRVDGEAEGASHALELLRDHRPHLLVADVNLAEGNPFTLIAVARAILPTSKVVLVASASDPPNFQSHIGYRPEVVLLRPFRTREFLEGVTPKQGSDAPVTKGR